MSRQRPDASAFVEGICAHDRAWLARALTLVESSRPEDRLLATRVFGALGSPSQPSIRLGISGVPGAGKSTFIEALGMKLVREGHRVGVLAIDPSSVIHGGSILGDKTRMVQLSVEDRAFVRPSPSRGVLGGVGRRTRESLALMEAAGFDVILVETVGVGQSEVAVADLVDSVILLALAGAGDQLQGIKRGILEVADVIAFHKADGDNAPRARQAAESLSLALGWLRNTRPGHDVPVLTLSSVEGRGLDEAWQAVLDHRAALGPEGIEAKRRGQRERAWKPFVMESLWERFWSDMGESADWKTLEASVFEGRSPMSAAAGEVLECWERKLKSRA